MSGLLKQILKTSISHGFLQVHVSQHTPETRQCWDEHNSHEKRRRTHMNTLLVLSPDEPAFLLELLRFLLGVLVPLALWDVFGMCNGGLEISFKPCVEARVICMLERCTFV